MMSLKEQGPNDIADTPMAVSNHNLLLFYTKVTKALSTGGAMEQFHKTIQQGDEGSILDFITAFTATQRTLRKVMGIKS